MKPIITRFFFTGILLLINFCAVAQKQRVKVVPRKVAFDFGWKFTLGSPLNAEKANFDDRSWDAVDLPHDWSIAGEIKASNPSGNDGGYFPAGLGWYRKMFRVPSAYRNKKVTIYFEGVYMNAEVFINGKSLGIRPYGYSSFSYNITPYLDYNGKNSIAVKVDNAQQKNSRWYSGSGIYRHVWLMVTDQVYIDHWGVAITTPDVTKDKALVQLTTTVKNESNTIKNLVLNIALVDSNQVVMGKEQLKVVIAPNQTKIVTQRIVINNPSLWTPSVPNLYSARLALTDGNREADRIVVPFGIRTINFSADKGFLLNGETVIINGGCLHHDNGALGAAAYDRAEIRKVLLMKAAGFNAVRTSHNPPSEAFLNACDSLGLLVMDESFDGWRTKKTDHDYAKYFDQWWH